MEYVTLGNTGIRVSRLGIGTGTVGGGQSSNQTQLGDSYPRLLLRGFDLGVNYWDLAHSYGSHIGAGVALRQLRRQDIVITSKIGHKTAEEVDRYFGEALRDLGTDYVDMLLMHCFTSPEDFERRRPAWDAMLRLKDEGKVRAVGFSTHNFAALERGAGDAGLEVVLARLNYAGVKMDVPEPARVIAVLERYQRAGQGVSVMKVLGQGELTADPAGAIRYAMGQRCVGALVIGIESEEQLVQNVETINAVEAEQLVPA